ncbi:tRNA(Glu)-specific nuclease WapA [Andreprevotia sp. IGB-42]|uniref:RHS repeat domain-containing protein n=1 Tax=Andreprevotia sp. IGB-42 TaxID=2497473 RepID=UPI001358FF65|nr:RHS repeat-associated core domain-containing protein [Andreprevotia sp. IGB-42]KAF0812714.1 tRNA(Glu)-specific nuclease WapA [Andreprevotia sp. IGB-42]
MYLGTSRTVRITRPDGTYWQILMDPSQSMKNTQLAATRYMGGIPTQITTPWGGWITYRFAWQNGEVDRNLCSHGTSSTECSQAANRDLFFANRNVNGPVFWKKATSDNGSWTLADNENIDGYGILALTTPVSTRQMDVRIGSTLVSSEVSSFVGTGDTLNCNYDRWRVGLLKEKRIKNGSGADMQVETSQWQPRLVVPTGFQYSSHVGWNGCDGTSGVNFPWQSQHKVVLGNGTYVTDISSVDAYLRPLQVVETATEGGVLNTGKTRTTVNTYETLAQYWRLDLQKTQQITATGQAQGSSSSTIFDIYGNATSRTQNGVTVGFSYDAAGNLASVTSPRGAVTTFSNYTRGTPGTIVKPIQSSTDPASCKPTDVSGTWTLGINAYGQVENSTDPLQRVTRFAYDNMGRLITITPAIGNQTTISWAANSRSLTRGPYGNAYTEDDQYDGFGRTISSSSNGSTVIRSYDALGRQTFQSYVNTGLGDTTDYDALSRPTRVTHSDSSALVYGYTNADYYVTSERGYTTIYRFLAYGNPGNKMLTKVEAPQSVATATTTIDRDLLGNVKSVTQNGVTRYWGYDSRFFLTSRTDPEIGLTQYGRDAEGNLTSRQVGSQAATLYGYDAQNRLLYSHYNDGSAGDVCVRFDAAGQLKSNTNGSAARSYSYDQNGNLKQEALVAAGKTLTLGYNYNSNDALDSIVYPDGRSVAYAPDRAGRPTKAGDAITGVWYHPNGLISNATYSNGLGMSQTLDSRLRPKNVRVGNNASAGSCSAAEAYAANPPSKILSDAAGSYVMVRDASGNLVRQNVGYVSLGDEEGIVPMLNLPKEVTNRNSTTWQTFNSQLATLRGQETNHLDSSTCATSNSTVDPLNTAYGYDSANNITSISDSSYPGLNRVLAYDGLDRLITANAPNSWGNGSIAYDGNGNITGQSFGSFGITQSYNTATQKLTSVSGSKAYTLSYDGWGNVTSRGDGQTFTYDAAGNLGYVNKAQGSQIHYYYDGSGTRVASESSTLSKVEFTGQNGLLYYEQNLATGVATSHLYLGRAKVADIDSSTGTTLFHNDLLGSPIGAFDVNGNLLWRANYRPYGDKVVDGDGSKNKQWFTGKPYEDQTGLSYFGARWYDPVLGRFGGMDPVDWNEKNPIHSFNALVYANNNPFKYIDPDGRSPGQCWACLFGTAVHERFFAYAREKGFLANTTAQGTFDGRVDLMDPKTRTIAEIKSAASLASASEAKKAAEQLLGYVQQSIENGKPVSIAADASLFLGGELSINLSMTHWGKEYDIQFFSQYGQPGQLAYRATLKKEKSEPSTSTTTATSNSTSTAAAAAVLGAIGLALAAM